MRSHDQRLIKRRVADINTVQNVDIVAADFFSATEKEVLNFTWIYYGWDGVAA
jgi:hypothetical protein